MVEPLLPKPEVRQDRRGRPHQDEHKIGDGILWSLRTGTHWDELPLTFPPTSTCHDRFPECNRIGALAAVRNALAEELRERGALGLLGCLSEATGAAAKKGKQRWATPSAATAAKSWQGQTLRVF